MSRPLSPETRYTHPPRHNANPGGCGILQPSLTPYIREELTTRPSLEWASIRSLHQQSHRPALEPGRSKQSIAVEPNAMVRASRYGLSEGGEPAPAGPPVHRS